MKQEEKDLLLKDLCSRQMYNVKCQVFNDVNPYTLSGVLYNKPYNQLYFEELDWKEHDGFVGVEYCKPYLFPLSSMTEEQKENLDKYIQEDAKEAIEAIRNNDKMFHAPWRAIDWLNKNNFDYRGLIEKGLAIDATNKNIY